MKTITGIVLHYNYIINMMDCGLKVTVSIWLLKGRDEHSCYIWAMVFVWIKCCRYCAIPTISIIRLISILVEKYQIQYSTLKLVVLASLVSLAATMVAVLPIKPVLRIGFFAQVSLYSVQKYLNLCIRRMHLQIYFNNIPYLKFQNQAINCNTINYISHYSSVLR